MAHLHYHSYKGVGVRNLARYYYTQSVRIGSRIECAGQGGWNSETGEIPETVQDQVGQAFQNVELALKQAGSKGWSQVYRINSYHVPLDDETIALMVDQMKKWMPNHQPIWTFVGVAQLPEQGMKVLLEVQAELS